jgi:GxxExxY protein
LKVHKKLGNGYREEVYQRCLAIEFDKIGLSCSREIEMPIYYENTKVGIRRADFVVEKKVIVETKAIKKLENDDWAQAINYLEAFDYEIGLLINFGNKSLEFKRFINTMKSKRSVKSV